MRKSARKIADAQEMTCYQVGGLRDRISAEADCADCGALAGMLHVPGCHNEICPLCHKLVMVDCECLFDAWDSEEGEKIGDEKKTVEKSAKIAGKAKQKLLAKIKAGLPNIWLHGPAGCGKTTICKEVAGELGLEIVILSCGAGTAPAEITGFKYPEPRHSSITEAMSRPGIIVFDEFTALQPDVAQAANAMMANGEILSSMGRIIRHKECVIIATSNTTGEGADRVYVANNQLDASTRDRFSGAMIEVDYDTEYESKTFDQDVCEYVWKLRESVKRCGIRQIVSTRAMAAAQAMKNAGIEDYKTELISAWTKDEKAAVAY